MVVDASSDGIVARPIDPPMAAATIAAPQPADAPHTTPVANFADPNANLFQNISDDPINFSRAAASSDGTAPATAISRLLKHRIILNLFCGWRKDGNVHRYVDFYSRAVGCLLFLLSGHINIKHDHSDLSRVDMVKCSSDNVANCPLQY